MMTCFKANHIKVHAKNNVLHLYKIESTVHDEQN